MAKSGFGMVPLDFDSTTPGRLAELFGMPSGPNNVWRTDELAAILQHQLAAPLEVDLGGKSNRADAGSSADSGLKTFADLLKHPHPPIELLSLTKQFAKRSRKHADSPLPPEIATILYLASIAAAIVRCRHRLTALDDASLRTKMAWAAEQVWVDDWLRSLIRIAIVTLSD